ncbi:MAG: YceI family protein [Bacteroidota bacterium]
MRFLILIPLLYLLPSLGERIPEREAPPSPPTSIDEAASLIVFSQSERDRFFLQQSLPEIRQLAQQLGIAIEERQAVDGLPAELTSTPAIVFQNYRGRSLYAGRYTEISTIKNFIRTSRRLPQQAADNCRDNVLAWRSGRTQLVAPIKLTELQGKKPRRFKAAIFAQEAERAFRGGMQQFLTAERACIEKSDRTFYFDVHPYYGKDGQLVLSAEVYAQFSCIKSIWSNYADPLRGAYTDFPQLFAQLGQQMEAVVFQHLREAENGDALSVVDEAVPVRSWEALDIVLPEAPANQTLALPADFSVPQQWKYFGVVDEDTPQVQFRFPEPLDRYSGEVSELSGTLALSADLALQAGRFEVATSSMTMGSADLDAKVLKYYLKSDKFPRTSFSFDKLEGQSSLAWGQTTATTVEGDFKLLNIVRPVRVVAQLTPLLDDDGRALLQVEASFTLNITDDFKIKGPDGPDPARKTLLFNLNFLLQQSTI